jgi:hypothetical protein
VKRFTKYLEDKFIACFEYGLDGLECLYLVFMGFLVVLTVIVLVPLIMLGCIANGVKRLAQCAKRKMVYA